MPDENNTGLIAAIAETDTPVTAPTIKKQRAPRRQKQAVEPVRATSKATTAKSPAVNPAKRDKQDRTGKLKRVEAQVKDATSTPKDATKSTGRQKAAKPVEQTAKTRVSAIDEMADLVQLEEENKRLRKTLAEKLRAENAELRKRLGLN
jgi:putative transposase